MGVSRIINVYTTVFSEVCLNFRPGKSCVELINQNVFNYLLLKKKFLSMCLRERKKLW